PYTTLFRSDVAQADGQRYVPQLVIGRSIGRVGPDQGDGGSHQQDDAAGSLDMHEALNGGKGPLSKKLGPRQILPGMRVGHLESPARAARPTQKPVLTATSRRHTLRAEYSGWVNVSPPRQRLKM